MDVRGAYRVDVDSVSVLGKKIYALLEHEIVGLQHDGHAIFVEFREHREPVDDLAELRRQDVVVSDDGVEPGDQILVEAYLPVFWNKHHKLSHDVVVELDAVGEAFHIRENTKRVPAEIDEQVRADWVCWIVEFLDHSLSEVLEHLLHKLRVPSEHEAVVPGCYFRISFLRFFARTFARNLHIARDQEVNEFEELFGFRVRNRDDQASDDI